MLGLLSLLFGLSSWHGATSKDEVGVWIFMGDSWRDSIFEHDEATFWGGLGMIGFEVYGGLDLILEAREVFASKLVLIWIPIVHCLKKMIWSIVGKIYEMKEWWKRWMLYVAHC